MWENHGIGKKLFARCYAKEIMCLNNGICDNLSDDINDKESINKCDSCIKFEANSNLDYIELVPDGNKIKVDQIRQMQEKIAEKPIISNKKVYVIDDADSMTEEGQNCLLKTLEEPPEYAVIILIVSNENQMLATIKSRCVMVKFEKLTDKDIKKIIPDASDNFIKILGGSLSNAQNAKEKEEQFNELEKIVETIENGTLIDLFNKSELLYNNKDDIMNMLEYLNIIFFEKKWIKPIEIVEKTKKKILSNNNYELCIDYLLMNIYENIN